jgi:hypothetical protein
VAVLPGVAYAVSRRASAVNGRLDGGDPPVDIDDLFSRSEISAIGATLPLCMVVEFGFLPKGYFPKFRRIHMTGKLWQLGVFTASMVVTVIVDFRNSEAKKKADEASG